jgi:hypothetical protein
LLYRVFPHVPGRPASEEGGALYVPRERQGAGRHDNPDHYGALYVSRDPESAVAERIQAFRGQVVTGDELRRRDGTRYAIAALNDEALGPLVDLDDPSELVFRELRPSAVASRDRRATQSLALSLYREGVPGFAWWSTLDASWSNATLFAERAGGRLKIEAIPEPLSIDHPVLRAAADALGIHLA